MNIRSATLVSTFLLSCAAPLVAASAPAVAGPVGTGSLCAPPADTVGPEVTQVTFGQPTIDLNTGSRIQTIAVTASDTSGDGLPSGVARIFVGVRGNRFGANPRLTLTSGTPASGEWTGQFEVSKYAHPGPASLYYISVADGAGNQQSYPGYGKVPESPNALSLHPEINPTFTVTGTPAVRPRKQPGTLRLFSFDPRNVDTTNHARSVQVVAVFKGHAPDRVSVVFYNPKRTKGTRYVYLRATLKDHNGKWLGSARVPRWIGDQTFEPHLYASWGANYQPRSRNYDVKALRALDAPTELTAVSGTDTKPPTLTSLSFSPPAIDSTSGPELVTVTAQATDDRSGVRFIDVNGGIRHGINGVADGTYPLAAAGIGYLSSDSFHVRLRETANGDWAGTTKVKRCVPSGTYKLEVRAADHAGNDNYYSTKELRKAGITSTVEVTSKHGDIENPYIYSAATLGAKNWLILNFTEGVANVNTSTLTVYPLSPADSRFTTPAAVTDITCYNPDTDNPVDCSGADGLVTAAVLTVPDIEAGKRYAVFANLDQVTPQLVDGNGNPMEWNYESTGVLGSRTGPK